MTRIRKYPEEIRREAVRLVRAHRDEYGSEWAAITSVASKFGAVPQACSQTLRSVAVATLRGKAQLRCKPSARRYTYPSPGWQHPAEKRSGIATRSTAGEDPHPFRHFSTAVMQLI